ncbi:hypothetical protein ZWY2020_055272 [Hordeum vulgare]|nr:hypothetical protein ZWY2020_055272 [Hordeum vulgare]
MKTETVRGKDLQVVVGEGAMAASSGRGSACSPELDGSVRGPRSSGPRRLAGRARPRGSLGSEELRRGEGRDRAMEVFGLPASQWASMGIECGSPWQREEETRGREDGDREEHGSLGRGGGSIRRGGGADRGRGLR